MKSLSNIDCNQNNEHSFQGIDIFEGSDLTQSTSIITISGWIFLRGYESQFYTILSLKEGTNTLISLSYNLSSKIIKMTSFTLYNQLLLPDLVKNKWIFFIVQVEYISGQVKACSYLYLNGLQNIIPQLSSNITPVNFQKNLIQLHIGLPDFSSTDYPSCAFIKNCVLFWDQQISPSQIGSLIGDISSIYSEIKWNFDFFYTKINKGQLISSQDNKIMKLDLRNELKDDNMIKQREYFITDYINTSESNGFTLSFDIYLESVTYVGENFIFGVYYNNGQIFQFFVNEVQYIIVKYISPTININILQLPCQENKWFNIMLVLQSGYKNQSFLLINSKDTPSFNPITQKLTAPLAIIRFGYQYNLRDFRLNNIVFIKGSQFKSTNDCKYQISNFKGQQECIICENAFTKDIENGMTCLDTTTVQQSDDGYEKKKWIRNNCGKGMTHKQGLCVCDDQFYLSNGECIRCPFACNGCFDGFTCKKVSDYRDIYMQCPFNRFDDGYQCLEQQLTNSKKIKKLEISYYDSNFICDYNIDSSSYYTFTSNHLNYFNQDPILYTFTFFVSDLSMNQSVISVVSDSNNGEILTITGNFNQIELNIKGFQTFIMYINSQERFQVGIWTDWFRVIFFVYNNSQILQSETFFVIMPVSGVKICVGPCKSQYFQKYLCGNLNDRPFIFIKNISYGMIQKQPIDTFIKNYQQYPIYNDFIGQILATEQVRIALFKTDSSNPIMDEQTIYDNVKEVKFNLSKSLLDIDKGIFVFQETQGVAKLNQNLQFPLTISLYILIDEMVISCNLLNYEMNGYSILYQLVPQDDSTVYSIRICFDRICQETAYAKLYKKQSNHLMIIPRNKSKFALDISLIQFEIVCNYMRESLTFLNILKPVQPTADIFIFLNNAFNTIKLFVNKIRLYTGDGSVSFNTDNSDNCFIYSNLEQTNCIFPKRGFVTLKVNPFSQDDIAISIDECIQMNQKQSSGVYTYRVNSYINECLVSCKHPYTDYSKQCQCIEGYVSKITADGQTICVKCREKCQTCKGTKDHCLLCKVSHLQGPSCNCTEVNTYLDQSTNTCLPCSDKCSSCVDSQDNCLTCSQSRINPPQCVCDERYYKQEGDKCIEIKCSDKCEKCEDKPNYCVQCKSGRQYPPDCLCIENYLETTTGECIPCPQFTYYDLVSNSCLPCDKPCLECSKNKNNCISCISGFMIDNFECLCPNGQKGQLKQNGDIECFNDMNVQIYLDKKGNYYQFNMLFTNQIQEIQQLKQGDFIDILNLYIVEIDKKHYTLTDFTFNKEELSFKLQVNSNFVATQAILTIQQNELFKSKDGKSVLSSFYKDNLFKFKIGPNIFKEDDLSNENIDNTINFLKNQNSGELKLLQQLQLILYLLNTVQPTSLFLILQSQLPPNLYKFCQIFGLLIYPSVSDYQSPKIQEEYTLFGLNLNENEVYLDCQFTYQKLGFSNSLLINIPIILIKYFIIFLLLGIFQLATSVSFYKIDKPIFYKIKTILIQRLNTENEINLLLTTLSILLQFRCIDEHSYASRYGLYLGLIFFIYLITHALFNYYTINQTDQNQNSQKNIDLQVYSILFTDRIQPQEKNKYKRNYFFMQLLKKYLQILILFIFHTYPQIAAPLCGILLLASCISTMVLQPYKKLRTRLIKSIGELLLSICWFLCILFPNIENQFNKNNIIENSLFEKYIQVGSIIIYLLIAFNGLFIIELIFTVIQTLSELIDKKPKQLNHPKLILNKQNSKQIQKLNKK